jgi:phage terminase large subunit-like protein
MTLLAAIGAALVVGLAPLLLGVVQFPTDAELDRDAVRRGGFKAFVKLAWDQIPRNKALVWNWHMDVVCEELEALALDQAEGRGGNLALCVPPGSSKSQLASVLFQAWVWTWWPQSSWAVVTYEESLALSFSAMTRDLIQSVWYQERWTVELTGDAKSEWENEHGGCRVAVGTGGSITGRHFDFHIGDDLIKEQESREGLPQTIAAHMAKACGFWFGTMITRAASEAVSRVVIGQRLHLDDVPGVAIREYGYRAVVIPALWEPEIEGCFGPDRDPRRTPGEPMDPNRRTTEGWALWAKGLGPISARAELQQDPLPAGGRVLKADYLDHRLDRWPSTVLTAIHDKAPFQGQEWITVWDLSFKGKNVNSRVAWGVLCREGADTYIVDASARHMGFLEACNEIRDVRSRYPWVLEHDIEDAANAAATEETLRHEVPGLKLVPHGGGALARTQRVIGIWAAGQVHLPTDAPWLGGSDGLVAEHLSFDGVSKRRDDYVSMTSLGLCRLYGGGNSAAFEEAMDALAGR